MLGNVMSGFLYRNIFFCIFMLNFRPTLIMFKLKRKLNIFLLRKLGLKATTSKNGVKSVIPQPKKWRGLSSVFRSVQFKSIFVVSSLFEFAHSSFPRFFSSRPESPPMPSQFVTPQLYVYDRKQLFI